LPQKPHFLKLDFSFSLFPLSFSLAKFAFLLYYYFFLITSAIMEGTPTQYESKESCTTATTTTATTASNTTIDNDCPRFRPFATLPTMKLKVRKAKYSTSLDPRGYIPGKLLKDAGLTC
jgi:hypothetical protein